MALARVLDVSTTPKGVEAVVAIGDREQAVTCAAGLAVQVGDIVELDAGGMSAMRVVVSPAAGGWSATGDAMRWRRPGPGGRSRMEILRRRQTVRTTVRRYLDGEGFLEIDAPLLVRGTTPDQAIASVAVGDRYLTTSTEYQLRRLEIGGFDKVYSLTANFREGESSERHNPEFTMLEWGRVGEPMAAIECDLEEMICRSHQALGGSDTLTYQGHRIDLTRPWPHLTVTQATEQVAGVPLPDFSLPSILRAVDAAGVLVRDEWRDDRVYLFALLMDHVQSRLGFERPVFMSEWPAFQTSSAQGHADGETAERTELVIAGLEVSNGFPALNDHDGQIAAFERQLARRKVEGLPPVALDERYLEALRLGMPPESAMAMGFDRLVMLLTDQTSIRAVMAFAWDEL